MDKAGQMKVSRFLQQSRMSTIENGQKSQKVVSDRQEENVSSYQWVTNQVADYYERTNR
ncbi:hypothetical protein J2S03_001362 [Alicyclobacillus cycloheptanicus]|uniref:Uncharacterized protein n=1 Tax=Alicyclobacillus cycloheptanicus TaxID=1457 RepID=A0ABT9XHD9_9BACL|nr:hypothetical protein [Alicyclobacillus cycloheptanicus]